jgi:hypothetical protein
LGAAVSVVEQVDPSLIFQIAAEAALSDRVHSALSEIIAKLVEPKWIARFLEALPDPEGDSRNEEWLRMVESLLRRGFDLQIAPGVICRALVSGSDAVVAAALRVRLLLPVDADQRRGWRALERVIEEVPRSFEVRQLAIENLLRVANDYGDGAEYPEGFCRMTICLE